jgi:hypothetical protein
MSVVLSSFFQEILNPLYVSVFTMDTTILFWRFIGFSVNLVYIRVNRRMSFVMRIGKERICLTKKKKQTQFLLIRRDARKEKSVYASFKVNILCIFVFLWSQTMFHSGRIERMINLPQENLVFRNQMTIEPVTSGHSFWLKPFLLTIFVSFTL